MRATSLGGSGPATDSGPAAVLPEQPAPHGPAALRAGSTCRPLLHLQPSPLFSLSAVQAGGLPAVRIPAQPLPGPITSLR